MAERQPADRGDLEALFLAYRPVVAHLAGTIARRQGLRGDDADDFAGWVNLRLIERDYALFAAVREARDQRGYLAVVVANLGHEYRNQVWGRWRPSAAARRQGPVAVRLEMLVYRDGLRLDEAAQMLRSAGLTALSDRELAAMLAACPTRPAARPGRAGDTDATATEAAERLPDLQAHADGPVMAAEAEAERRSIGAQLAAAVAQLPAEEQVMVRLRYWQGLSVADVARALGVLQKPLYRRLERVLAGLHAELERRGVDRESIRALLGEPRPPDEDDPPPALAPAPPPDGAGPAGDARPPPRRDFGPPQPSL